MMTGPHLDRSSEARLWNLARGAQDVELEHHIAACETCQQELSTLRQLVRYKQTTGGELVELPMPLHASVENLFRSIRPDLIKQDASPLDRALHRLQRITATLMFDSGTVPQMAGLRSATDKRTRQFAFVSDLADLDLEVSRDDEAFLVAGQLGMNDVPSGLVIVFTPGDQNQETVFSETPVETDIDSDGHFSLTLTAGEWDASVLIDDAVLLFTGVRL